MDESDTIPPPGQGGGPSGDAGIGDQAPDQQVSGHQGQLNAHALVGTVVAERYRVERLLGEGAMGAVFRAEHIHMQKPVALKVLHTTMSQNPEVVRRFEREAVAAGRIDHPNVAGATDFGRLADGSFYLVLEFINGKSLGQLMEEVGAMTPERACRITIQIAAALSAAHAAGIVHRDLKPENVMMPHSDGENDVIKVLDFGMAKLQQADTGETKLTMHGAVYGTPQYMAPEQAAGQDVDHRADLYAVGLMLYEMLSGRVPFEAETMMALLIKHMTEKVPPLPAAVPRQLSKLVYQCLEKKPEDRVQSADEIIQRLTDFLGVSYQDPRRSAVGLPAPNSGYTPRPPASTVTAMRVAEKVAPFVERAQPLIDKAAPLVERAVEASSPAVSFLKQPMTVAGRTFPRWVPVATGAGFVLTLLLLLSGGSESDIPAIGPTTASANADSKQEPVAPQPQDPAPPDPELAKVISQAKQGVSSALYALEQRKDSERSLTEWLGLAHARLREKNVEGALAAFSSAIAMDKSAAYDEQLLGGLRKLADEDQYAPPILDFVASKLGGVGADFLFHVWAKTALKTQATTIAFDKLTSSSVQANYSPGLKVAMALRDAEDCDDYLALMSRVEESGDDRSLTKLRALHKERGCGSSGRDDCYPCLRKGDELKRATQAAGMRKAPQFELSGFRFNR